jgi:biotin transport system substrate-specific component
VSSFKSWLWIPAFAAAIAAGAQIEVPLGEVPFTLQSFFVLLAGFTLGSLRGGLAVVLYLAAGALGLPVFSGSGAGAERLAGPTAGFLWGFLPMASIAGLAARNGMWQGWRKALLWGTLATVALLALGLPWLALSRGLGLGELAATAGSLLPGAAIKLAACILLCEVTMRRLSTRMPHARS